jgi:VanZ family protein
VLTAVLLRFKINHKRAVFAALGPGKWVPRSGLGWQIDHVVGYFGFTLLLCLTWPRPRVIGEGLMAFAVMLEALQAFTPDRPADLHAALYSAGGVLAAALVYAVSGMRPVRGLADGADAKDQSPREDQIPDRDRREAGLVLRRS